MFEALVRICCKFISASANIGYPPPSPPPMYCTAYMVSLFSLHDGPAADGTLIHLPTSSVYCILKLLFSEFTSKTLMLQLMATVHHKACRLYVACAHID